ncbi:hypothetical protein ACFZA9_03075 [Streptomyces olivaceus]|uniref:hypothetical protein n=1 Tax=Streptomyces olivaceus TaxID=47716 RepID=UPI0036EC8031
MDESSFDFRGLTEEQLTDALDDFSDALAELGMGRPVAVSPWWAEAECADGQQLYQVLYEGAPPRAGRDARLRMQSLMDRCPIWDTGLAGLPDAVELDATVREMAWSLGYALVRTGEGSTVGCLMFPRSESLSGWRKVSAGTVEASVYLFSDPSVLPGFWRELFHRENVAERDFFVRAGEAFPRLVFADSLAFNKFDGSCLVMRDWVVAVLGVVHDHFADAYAANPGNTRAVQAALGNHGLNLSPESPNTRSKPKIMKQRDVDYENDTYRCEWHGKEKPDRNRIHFSLPDQRLGGRILIGIFTDHLDVE